MRVDDAAVDSAKYARRTFDAVQHANNQRIILQTRQSAQHRVCGLYFELDTKECVAVH